MTLAASLQDRAGQLVQAAAATGPSAQLAKHITQAHHVTAGRRRPAVHLSLAAMSANNYPTVTYVPKDRRSNRIWWVLGGLVLLLAIIAVLVLRVAFSSLPPGTTVAGVTVRSLEQAAAVGQDLAAQLNDLPVELRTTADTTTTTAGQLGATLDVDRLRTAAQTSIGANAWIERFTGGGPVQLPVDVAVAEADLTPVADAVSRDPVDGAVQIIAAELEVTEPVPGVDVEPADVKAAITPPLTALGDLPPEAWQRPLLIEIEGSDVEPTITQVSLDAAVAEFERITDGKVQLTTQVVPEDAQTVDEQGLATREEATLTVTGDELAQLLATEVDPSAVQQERIQIVADTATPPPTLLEFVAAAAVPPDMRVRVENRSPTPPRDASGTGSGGPADQPRLADVSTVTGTLVAEVQTPGLEPDLDATIRNVVAAAVDGQPAATVAGQPLDQPDPALLGIVQPVSTYTTFYNPGEARVVNIHRIAEIVDNTLIPPGANYEVNHAVGPRTADKGFVESGAILDGEFVQDVGGGVSQFGTTFFNAMWFSGVDIITHTPHSYYFERYPAGREATIDYPGVNLELNNNTPYWILVDTAVTPDSVTVTFWSTPYFTVEQSIGPREPVPGQDFRVTINRLATAPEIPELDLEGFADDDHFTHTYGIPPP